MKQLTSEENQALTQHLNRAEPDVAFAFQSIIANALKWRGTTIGFPKSVHIVFKSPRFNFAECAVQRECVRIRLRRLAQIKDPRNWLEMEPKMQGYALNKYFQLQRDSDLQYATELLQQSYTNAAGIEPDDIFQS